MGSDFSCKPVHSGPQNTFNTQEISYNFACSSVVGYIALGIILFGWELHAIGIQTRVRKWNLLVTVICTIRKVLVKGAAVLDLLHGCTSVGLDKTGTLTQGSLTCTAIYSSKSEVSFEGKYIDDSACKELLGRAVALSQLTSHPVAQAVARIGKKLGTVPPVSIKNFKSYPGEGVAGTVDSPNEAPRQLYFGSLDFVAKFLPERLHKQMHETIANAGYRKSISILLEQSGKMNEWAVFCFEDELRTNSADAVSALRTGSWKTGNPISSFKKNVVMLTGTDSALLKYSS